MGRDLLSRLIYGARISLAVGFAVVLLSASVGTFLGLASGYWGGRIDYAVMRCIDILMAFPSILLAIVVVSILGPGVVNTVIAVSVVAVPSFTRIVRASVMEEKVKTYVMASRSFGANPFRIMFREVFPNSLGPLIVQATFGFSEGIFKCRRSGFFRPGCPTSLARVGSDARRFTLVHRESSLDGDLPRSVSFNCGVEFQSLWGRASRHLGPPSEAVSFFGPF